MLEKKLTIADPRREMKHITHRNMYYASPGAQKLNWFTTVSPLPKPLWPE